MPAGDKHGGGDHVGGAGEAILHLDLSVAHSANQGLLYQSNVRAVQAHLRRREVACQAELFAHQEVWCYQRDLSRVASVGGDQFRHGKGNRSTDWIPHHDGSIRE